VGTRQIYQQRVKSELKWSAAQIEAWREKGSQVGPDMRRDWEEQLQALRAIFELAQTRFEELKRTGDESWEDVRARTDGVLSELRQAALNASLRFH
jgi:hypothetical protein